MIRPLQWLKDRFSANKKPTWQDFWDLFDSFVHISQQEAVDAQVVNQAIGAALNGITAPSNDGIVNSLGDVFAVFTGYSQSNNLQQKLTSLTNAAKWTGLPGKPAQASLRWTEQVISTDPYSFNPLQGGSYRRRAWLLADLGLVTGSAVILDIDIQRSYLGNGGSESTAFDLAYKPDTIMRVKIGVTPNVSLQ